MRPRARQGVSTYLETFLLIAIATAGSALVFSATGQYAQSASGAEVTLYGASIRQGACAGSPVSCASEMKVMISNTGTVPASSLTISAPGITSSPYCYALTDPATGSVVSADCPTMVTSPSVSQFSITTALNPGQSVILTVLISSPSAEFTVGTSYLILLSTSAAAQWQVSAVATGA